jgi:hypothetical protein
MRNATCRSRFGAGALAEMSSRARAVRAVSGTVTCLPRLADDAQPVMAPIGVEILDVGVQRFGDAQPVHRQQREQPVKTR